MSYLIRCTVWSDHAAQLQDADSARDMFLHRPPETFQLSTLSQEFQCLMAERAARFAWEQAGVNGPICWVGQHASTVYDRTHVRTTFIVRCWASGRSDPQGAGPLPDVFVTVHVRHGERYCKCDRIPFAHRREGWLICGTCQRPVG